MHSMHAQYYGSRGLSGDLGRARLGTLPNSLVSRLPARPWTWRTLRGALGRVRLETLPESPLPENPVPPARQIVDLEEVILPGNARLFHHDAECFDWGTLGWIMSAGMVDVQDYKYFVMVNSGVRGPYAPPYEPVRAVLAAACAGMPAHACCWPWAHDGAGLTQAGSSSVLNC